MTSRIKRLAFVLLLAGLSARSEASLSYDWSGEQAIRDNDPSGLAFSFNVSDSATTLTSVTIALSLSGGWNGDLYAYLSSANGFAVLLNQVGVDASNPHGYADSGMDVTLVSGSGHADIHTYQSASPTYTLGGQLTGTWQADGRFLDPLSGTRANTLDVFNGTDPNGVWTLFFADRNGGEVSTLTGWSVTFGAVPEPGSLALLLAGSLALLARRRKANHKPHHPVPHCGPGR